MTTHRSPLTTHNMHQLQTWFAHPWGFGLLAILPVMLVVAIMAGRRRRRTLVRFGTLPALRTLTSVGRGLRFVRRACLVFGLLLLVAGIAGPRWGWDWEQSAAPGRDLVVVLDLSRSMLAQDVLPSRVERAKKALVDLSYAIQQRGGHRLALVAFAARARIFCPLTHDYDHFRAALADLDPVFVHPELRPEGKNAASGTRIGAGLHAAVEAHDPRFRGTQDILLITDGDDPAPDADRDWQEGLAEARERNIPIHTVGLGNPLVGSPIPLRGDELLRHQGEVVLTRLKERPLEAMARLTGGSYTPARTHTFDLGQLFEERIEPGATHEETDENLPVYRQRYSWFLGCAFSFLGFEMVLGQKRRRELTANG
ncbi:MAG: VWA domain-containing protein, partial [Planctomycetota bacterium]